MEGGAVVDENGDPRYADLRATARRVLEFERPFLRQRWASYYAAWACAIIAYFLLPFLLSRTGFATLPSTLQLGVLAGIDLALTAVAMAVLVVLWGLSGRANALRSAVDRRRSFTGPRNLLRLAVVLTIVAAALAVSTKSAFDADLLGDTTLLILSLLLLLHLHRAFRPVPPEGWLAVGAFVAAVGLSYTSLLAFDSAFGHLLAWVGAAVVWLGCAAYARFGIHDVGEGL